MTRPYMDEWEEYLFPASYGGMELDIVDTTDELSRALALHGTPHRDGAAAEDMGAEPRATDCTIVFFPNLLEQGHLDRLSAFLNLLHDGEAHTFVHPLTGPYRARPENIRMSASGSARDYVQIAVTFVEDDPEPAVFRVVEGDPAATAVEEVAVTAAELDTELASAGLSSPVGAEAVAVVESWAVSDGALTARQVNLELSRIANRIDDEAQRLELATDIDRQPILLAFRRLRQNLANAAGKAQTARSKLTTHTVATYIPLLALAQELYGGDGATKRAETILLLNDFGDPLYVRQGTVLTIEEPG